MKKNIFKIIVIGLAASPAVAAGPCIWYGLETYCLPLNGLVVAGGDASTSPSDSTIRGPNIVGTDQVGKNVTIQPGNGTGTGGSGELIFNTAPVGTTGTTANTMTERMRIQRNGMVGIGTSDPIQTLHVVGNGLFQPTSGSSQLTLSSPAATARDLNFQTSGVDRWVFRTTNVAETGSNAGSDFQILARNDSGGPLITAASIQRSTGFWGFGVGTPLAVIHIGGSKTGAPAANGSQFLSANATFTDNVTAASGTTASYVAHSIGVPTLTATNTSVTTTTAQNLRIVGPVVAGNNETITNDYGLFVAAANVAGTGGAVTNAWGLGVQAPTGATNNYAATFSGNVGMGNAADPASSLEIAGLGVTALTSDQVMLRSQRAAIVSGSMIGGIGFKSNDTNLTAPGTQVAHIEALAEATHTASALTTGIAFNTTDTLTEAERMRIAGNGNVGIGTTNPSFRITGVHNANAGTGILFSNTDTGTGAFVDNQMRNGATVAESLRFGVLGTGWTTAGRFVQNGAYFESQSSLTGGLSIGAINASAPIRFYAGGTAERVRFDSNGNVGIGTSVPGTLLDVAGQVTSRPFGTSTGQTGQILFRELAANGTNTFTIRAPDAITSDRTMTLPDSDAVVGARGQLPGTATNDSASAGNVGEYLSAASAGVATVCGSFKTIAQITLTPGDWDVNGAVGWDPGTSTGTTSLAVILSSTLDSSTQYSAYFDGYASTNAVTAIIFAPNVRTGPMRASVNTNTTIYLNARANCTTAGTSAYRSDSIIYARRVR